MQRKREEDFVCLCSGTKKLFAGATDKKILGKALNSLPRRFHFSLRFQKTSEILPQGGEGTRFTAVTRKCCVVIGCICCCVGSFGLPGSLISVASHGLNVATV